MASRRRSSSVSQIPGQHDTRSYTPASGAAAPVQLEWVVAGRGKARNRGGPWTDFHDLACRHGPEASASHLKAA
jgi:hypothetical protein